MSFIPYSIQRRVLRYALSHIDVLDTDALDLDSLDIAWGRKNVVELRDVALRTQKLLSILHLPPNFELSKATVRLLRVSIPTDLHATPIRVEARGVELKITIKPAAQAGTGQPSPSKSSAHGEEEGLPTAQDLAKSFLAEEPADEKKELEAALESQSMHLSDSESEDDLAFGTGTGISLPIFLTSWLKGVGDRLELTVRDIDCFLDPGPLSNESFPAISIKDDYEACLRLHIDDIGIEGVTTGSSPTPQVKEPGPRRRVVLQNVIASLIADSRLFNTQTTSTVPSVASPSANRSVSGSATSGSLPGSEIRHRTSSPQTSRSAVRSPTASISGHSPTIRQNRSESLRDSIITQDADRFADADDDGHDPVSTRNVSSMPLPGDNGSPTILEREIDDVGIASVGDSFWEDDPELTQSVSFHDWRTRRQLQSRRSASDSGSSQSLPLRLANLVTSANTDAPLWSSRSLDHVAEGQGILLSQSEPLAAKSSLPSDEASSQGSGIHYHEPSLTKVPSSGNSSGSDMGELAESQLFTHEQAESMYMSAMSQAPPQVDSRHGVPGAWEASPPVSDSGQPTIADVSGAGPSQPPTQDSDERDCVTPRPRSPTSDGGANTTTSSFFAPPVHDDGVAESVQPVDENTEGLPKTVRDFLKVDELLVWIPSEEEVDPPVAGPSEDAPKHRPSEMTLPNTGIEGSFSQYASATAARRRPSINDPWQSTASIRADSRSEESGTAFEAKNPLGLEASTITSHLDTLTSRILSVLILKLLRQLDTGLSTSDSSDPSDASPSHTPAPLNFQVKDFILSFVEEMSESIDCDPDPDNYPSPNRRAILVVDMKNIDISIDDFLHPCKCRLDIGRFELGNTSYKILSFDDSASLRTSTRVLKEVQAKAISAWVHKKANTFDIGVSTLPVIFNLDMPLLDETLSAFGGLSGVLELSNSISSNSPTPIITPKKPKSQGVHFAPSTPTVSPPTSDAAAKIKLNARIAGFTFTLAGRSASVALRTTAIKLVFRETVFGAQIDAVRLTCANDFSGQNGPPVTVDIDNSRLEFRFAPEESDLTRLVSLITPSKDKYEDDDDILLEILLRQRKRGPVVRLTSSAVRINIVNPEGLDQMRSLNEEITKLSTVTKYLPEDDSPGPLILCLIKDIDLEMPVNARFGSARVKCKNAQVAHVVFPPLSAVEVGTISVFRGDDEEIIKPVLRFPASEDSAMIMARMVGGEMEPTVKIKLHNLCCEYNVSTVMAILGLDEEGTVEELTTELALSIATITMDSENVSTRQPSPEKLERKPLQLDILLRDCAVGLNPYDSTAKALFLCTNTRLHGALPIDHPIKAVLDIRKASLLLIDDVERLDEFVERPPRQPAMTFGESKHARDLQDQGYVSIGVISAAQAVIQVDEAADGAKAVEVDFKDELFVMETCADSTQTLIGMASGLKPKSPPISEEQKYRTQVVPMEDMMASFTGDAFVEKEELEEESRSPDEVDLTADDFFADMEFVGSFYHPNSDHASDRVDQYSLGERRPLGPRTSGRNINRVGAFQGTILAESTPERIDFEENHIISHPRIRRGRVKWDSINNKFLDPDESNRKCAPLKLRVRDVHFIWNLFDGYDWPKTRDVIGKVVQDIESKAEERRRKRRISAEPEDEESAVGDFLFNSIWIEVPPNREAADLRRHINRNIDDAASESESYAVSNSTTRTATRQNPAPRKRRKLRLERSQHHKITFELKGISVDLIVFPPGSGETQQSLVLQVHDLEIFDHVPSSTWKKFCTYMHDAGERETGRPMIQLQVLNVRPVPELAASELVIKVNVLPLRLHVDQDALEFITRFFEFKDDTKPHKGSATPSDDLFIQRMEINTVRLRLDYKPKKVDYTGLRSGHTTEFMNFFILDQADILLRRVILYGVSGLDRLHNMLNDIWVPDVKRNQLPKVLAGLAPVRPFVNVGGGVLDLVTIPLREYKKDGRIVRSIQKGAASFARTTTGELARLGAKVAFGTHDLLSGAEGLLSPTTVAGPSTPRGDSDWEVASYPPGSISPATDAQRAVSHYSNQPMGVFAGLRGAARSLERDLLTTRDAIVAVPAEVIESENPTGAVAAMARRAPTVILRPVIGASKAIGLTLLGASNALDKDSQRKMDEKYKRY
ncbi:hypothetical protein P152DRAFT_223598 [Eremomyces bilateralis CBS 781.70]|uniref:Autophagy-related protein 2 n=1 Tax=Eremomyces bilateralis CBS 781.70 TaxID=1392243 RepID=A0A6G1FRP9_9PEZI|nr:uncharacterized protein P152DRAFT_223598 [Eremomyces bilateralis CBS 781.70]KAF1808349.1 hypothetical protein P152DRAFT_223598 [Eremomyces bilateralis CBS 781.70]